MLHYGHESRNHATGQVAMKTKQVKISELTPDDINANKGTQRGASLLEKSLREYGAGRSVLVDREGRIIAGNKTVEAAGSIGLEDAVMVESDGNQIVVVKRTDLSLDSPAGRGLAIADNRVQEVGLSWDMEALEKIGEEIDLSEFWFEEELPEIDFGSLDADGEGDGDAEAIPEKEPPKSVVGDLWLLGRHRILCGDATSVDDLEVLMAGERADLWLTDPPYNVNYEGKTKDKLVIENDSMSDSDFRQFLVDVYRTADSVMKEGAAFYIWHADSEGFNFRGAATDIGWKIRQCLIWVKNHMVMGRQDYHWKHEPCLYGWKAGAAHLWNTDRKQTTVLDFDRPSRNAEHPTMKPVDLFEYQLRNSTRTGAVVLDSFAGSGTTLIAAERSNRRAFVLELDPVYVDVCVKRWQDFTGKEAVDQHGRTFAQVTEERSQGEKKETKEETRE